jgi:hypothetical protein
MSFIQKGKKMFNFDFDQPPIPAMSATNLNNPVDPASQLIPSVPAIAAEQQANGFPSQSFMELAETMSQPVPDASHGTDRGTEVPEGKPFTTEVHQGMPYAEEKRKEYTPVA